MAGLEEARVGGSRVVDRLAIVGGQAFLSSDLAPADEINTLGLEASSDSAFGEFGWEFGLLSGSEDVSASDQASGLNIRGDLDLTEVYGGARKAFKLGRLGGHLGLGLSFANLDIDVARSLPAGGGVSTLDIPALRDSTFGGYAQAGVSIALGSSFLLGVVGRVRGAEDFEEDGNSVGGSISTVALRFSLRR